MLTVTLKSATKLFEDSDRGDVFLDFLKLKIKNTKINFVKDQKPICPILENKNKYLKTFNFKLC